MWPSIRRLRDWAMDNLRLSRGRSRSQAIHYRYKRAGLVVAEQPVPWNAEAVVVEALLRLAPRSTARKTDFRLRLAGMEPVPAEAFRRVEGEENHRVHFRLAPPGRETSADLLFRDRVLGSVRLPFLSREEFLRDLTLERFALFVRLGSDSVACQSFVPAQCRGLAASAVVHSPTNLVPLLDLDFHLEFRREGSDESFCVPVRLSGSQLTARSALVTLVPRRYPKKVGIWNVSWRAGDQVIARQRINGVS